MSKCEKCNGKGSVFKPRNFWFSLPMKPTCPDCKGTGQAKPAAAEKPSMIKMTNEILATENELFRAKVAQLQKELETELGGANVLAKALTDTGTVIKQLQKRVDAERWIPVGERLPEICTPYAISKDVFIICEGQSYKGYYEMKKGFVIYGSYRRESEYQDEVTHWKPINLPEQALSEKDVKDDNTEHG